VLDLYPGTKISIGPPIEDGFYYDFEFPDGVTVSEHDFEQLEAMMREHVKAHEPLVREDIPVADALERFTRASARREADSPADAASSASERSGTTTSETRTSTRCSAARSSASSGPPPTAPPTLRGRARAASCPRAGGVGGWWPRTARTWARTRGCESPSRSCRPGR
jgi:hypothetical protein